MVSFLERVEGTRRLVLPRVTVKVLPRCWGAGGCLLSILQAMSPSEPSNTPINLFIHTQTVHTHNESIHSRNQSIHSHANRPYTQREHSFTQSIYPVTYTQGDHPYTQRVHPHTQWNRPTNQPESIQTGTNLPSQSIHLSIHSRKETTRPSIHASSNLPSQSIHLSIHSRKETTRPSIHARRPSDTPINHTMEQDMEALKGDVPPPSPNQVKNELHNETIQHINQIYPDRQDGSARRPSIHARRPSNTPLDLSIQATGPSSHARRPSIIKVINQTSDRVADHVTISRQANRYRS